MTDIDADFKKAIKPQFKVPRFERDNAKLIPYIQKFMAARAKDADSVSTLSDFYDNFLKPHGITISKDRFYSVARQYAQEAD